MNIDYIIVGQGISGTLLSRQLIEAGQKLLVIDDANPRSASRIASGLINPVTGKKFVTTWLADELLPFAKDAYEKLGQQFGASFIREYELLNIHPTADAAALFDAREAENDLFLNHENNPGKWSPWFHITNGIGVVSPCYLIDVESLLNHWRGYLAEKNALRHEDFTLTDLEIKPDGIHYKDVAARKIIFCTGAVDMDNPYFTRLNFQLNKGEALIAAIPGLPADSIYKHGPLSVIPWKKDLFWIGSTFDREYTDASPTESYRSMTEASLSRWLKIPFAITDHLAAIRPATGGQKPFIGLHPLYPPVGIFNGMGSKGCSLAPYFAAQFTEHLLHGTPLHPEADIQRFARILSR